MFGVRPGSPFLFTIPATGQRPMEFAVEGLPDGLKVDAKTGQITGSLEKRGEYVVTFHVKNASGRGPAALQDRLRRHALAHARRWAGTTGTPTTTTLPTSCCARPPT